MKGRGHVARSLEKFKAKKNFAFQCKMHAAAELRLRVPISEMDDPSIVYENQTHEDFVETFSDFLNNAEMKDIKAWLDEQLALELVGSVLLPDCPIPEEESFSELDLHYTAKQATVVEEQILAKIEELTPVKIEEMSSSICLPKIVTDFCEAVTTYSTFQEAPEDVDGYLITKRRRRKDQSEPGSIDVIASYPEVSLLLVGPTVWTKLMYRSIINSFHSIPWQVQNSLFRALLFLDPLRLPCVVTTDSLAYLSMTHVLAGRVSLLHGYWNFLLPVDEFAFSFSSRRDAELTVYKSSVRLESKA